NGYTTRTTLNGGTVTQADCRKQKEDLYTRVIPTLHPDIIIAVNVDHEDRSELPFLGPDNKPLKAGPALYRWLDAKTVESTAAIHARGAKLVIVEPIPVTRLDPLACLSRPKPPEQCSHVATPSPDPLETFSPHPAKQPPENIPALALDRLICPSLPICDPIVNNQIVKLDPTHLTVAF